MPSNELGQNGILGYITIPTVTDGRNSVEFAVPRGARTMTLLLFSGVSGTTYKLQTLVPDNAGAAEVWRDVAYFDLATGGSPIAIASLPVYADVATTLAIPITAVGSGILRLVASADLTGFDAYAGLHVVYFGMNA